MRYFLAAFALIVCAVMLVAGKRGDVSRKPPLEIFPDMDRQPKLRPQARAEFFADGMSSRPPVPGVVARGAAYQDIPVNTGRLPGSTNWVETNPLPITAELLDRGHQRYQITCAPCHGVMGDGKGITAKYGMVAMANFHDKRLVTMTDGEMFNTITHGKNLMGPYGAVLSIADRWAVVAYVRALERSRLGSLDDVPETLRASILTN